MEIIETESSKNLITVDNYNNYLPENTVSKYKFNIQSKEYYSFLLQIKSYIRKHFKSQEKEDTTKLNQIKALAYFTVIKLYEGQETEAIVDFGNFFCEEMNKTSVKLEVDFYLTYFKFVYSLLTKKKYNKLGFIQTILYLLEKNNIKKTQIRDSGFYKLLAEDLLLSKDPINGFKFAIASEDSELLELCMKIHLDNTSNNLENLYLLVRTVMELLLLDNFKLASYLLIKIGFNHPILDELKLEKISLKDLDNPEGSEKLKNSHPLLNFSILILSCINQKFPWEKYSSFCKSYLKWLDNGDGVLKKYANQVSWKFYNRKITKEAGMNMLSMLSNMMGV